MVKHLTKEEIAGEIRNCFAPSQATVTFDVEYLINILSEAFTKLQAETEQRVRQEILRGTLN